MTQTGTDLTDFLKRVGIIALVVVLLFLAWKAADILLLLFFGVLLGVLLITLTSWIVRFTPIAWRWALGLVLILLVGLLVGAGWLVGPRLAQQVGGFNQQLNQSLQSIEQRLSESAWGRGVLERAPVLEAPDSTQPADTDGQATPSEGARQEQGLGPGRTQTQEPVAGLEGAGALLGNVFSSAVNILTTLFQLFGNIILVVFTAIFVAANPKMYQNGIAMLFPQPRRPRVREVLQELGRAIQGWLLVQLISMTVIGIMIYIGLTLIGVKLALVLAILAFLFEFIPIIGPWLAFAPAAVIALTGGGTQVLWVALLYYAANFVEGNLLVPLLQKHEIDVPPVLTLAAIFFFGAIFGPIGILVAAPLIAVLYVLVKLVYVQGTLHEPVKTPRDG